MAPRCIKLPIAAFRTLLLLGLALPAAADVRIAGDSRYPLSGHLSYLIDPGRQLTLQDVTRADVQAQFQPLESARAGPNFGFDTSAIWLRVAVDRAADAPRDWLLEVAYPPLDHLDLYTPD